MRSTNNNQPRFRWGAGRRRPAAAALAAAVAVLGLTAEVASAAKDDTALLSRPTVGIADDQSYDASSSADGRYVVFTSYASNLSDADADHLRDVFVRDNRTRAVTLVSRASGRDGAGADASSDEPAISANGRYVAFSSDAANLSGADADNVQDIFVRDLQTATTWLVSRTAGTKGVGGDNSSGDPSISADGSHVAFRSLADNLSGADDDDSTNVFVRDRKSARTKLVSRRPGAAGAGGNGSSTDPSISADGRRVAFESNADNLSSADINTYDNVFVRDIGAGRTTLVSRRSGTSGAASDGDSANASISADGRHVAFESYADNLSGADVNGQKDVFVRDIAAGRNTLVSRRSGTSGAGADGFSYQPSISANGRHVAFASKADNLSGADYDIYDDVFVRNVGSARTRLVSRVSGASGEGGDDHSTGASISASGRFVAFHSDALNLSVDDGVHGDVFRRDVLGP